MPRIEGKVARILNKYEVVINRGSIHGVEEGMRFIIYEPGEDIIDPETQASLGKYEYVKRKVRVVNVSDKFSTAKSDETYETSRTLANMLPSFSQPVLIELPLDRETLDYFNHELEQEGVKIGDSVRQILG
jgi:hypothetical protein